MTAFTLFIVFTIFSAVNAEITVKDVRPIFKQLCEVSFDTSFGTVTQHFFSPLTNSTVFAVVTLSGLDSAYVLDIKQDDDKAVLTLNVPRLSVFEKALVTSYSPEEWPVKEEADTNFIFGNVVVTIYLNGHHKLVHTYISDIELLDFGSAYVAAGVQNEQTQRVLDEIATYPHIFARERMAVGGYAVADTILTQLCRS